MFRAASVAKQAEESDQVGCFHTSARADAANRQWLPATYLLRCYRCTTRLTPVAGQLLGKWLECDCRYAASGHLPRMIRPAIACGGACRRKPPPAPPPNLDQQGSVQPDVPSGCRIHRPRLFSDPVDHLLQEFTVGHRASQFSPCTGNALQLPLKRPIQDRGQQTASSSITVCV